MGLRSLRLYSKEKLLTNLVKVIYSEKNALNDAAAANSLIERANFPIKNLNRPVGVQGLKVQKALVKRKNINEFSKDHIF